MKFQEKVKLYLIGSIPLVCLIMATFLVLNSQNHQQVQNKDYGSEESFSLEDTSDSFNVGDPENSVYWRTIDNSGFMTGQILNHKLEERHFNSIEKLKLDSDRMKFVPDGLEPVFVEAFNIDSSENLLELEESAQLIVSYKYEVLCTGDSLGPGCEQDILVLQILDKSSTGWKKILDYEIVYTNYAAGFEIMRDIYNGKDALKIWGGTLRTPKIKGSSDFILFSEKEKQFIGYDGKYIYSGLQNRLLTSEEKQKGCSLQSDIVELQQDWKATHDTQLVWPSRVICPYGDQGQFYKTVREGINVMYTIENDTLVPYDGYHIYDQKLYKGNELISDKEVNTILFDDSFSKEELIGGSMGEYAYAAGVINQYKDNGRIYLLTSYVSDCFPCSWVIPRNIVVDEEANVIGTQDLEVEKSFMSALVHSFKNNGEKVYYAYYDQNQDDDISIIVKSYDFITRKVEHIKNYYEDDEIFTCIEESLECMFDGKDGVQEYLENL